MSFSVASLPTQGVICVCEQLTEGMKNYWFDSAEDASKWSLSLDSAGRTIFIAQGSFISAGTARSGRKADNTAFFRNFFLDIDCGEGKPYASQKVGVAALKSFCSTANLPFPSVVVSGYGLYAHWVMDKDVPSLQWHKVARLLQAVVKHYEPSLDADGLVADRARILRPVDSHNRKRETPVKVQLVKDSGQIDTKGFMTAVLQAYTTIGGKVVVPKYDTLQNTQFLAGLNQNTPKNAELIAKKCAQIAEMKSTRGDMPEPLWYAAIGVLRYTTQAPDIIHEWSKGHAEYDYSKTEAKINQHDRAAIGPTTCARFSAENPEACAGCRFAGKITSPIQLGRELSEPLREESATTSGDAQRQDARRVAENSEPVTLPVPPDGFKITDNGLEWDDAGLIRVVYDYPIYVSSMNSDWFGESITIRHRLPHDGWKEFAIPSRLTASPKDFFSALLDAHVHIFGKENKGLFLMYIETFMGKLKKEKRISTLSGQMGWCDDADGQAFIHGANIYRVDGSASRVGYSATAPEFVKSMAPTGDTSAWVALTEVLNRPGLEGLAFEFLCGAFGSPLVKFTGYEGAMVSVVGGSGLGKTLTGRWGLSAWGNPRQLMLDPDDTKNALASRFGVYNNLPAYIDEISNITPENMSDLAYKITRGRDKLRLNRNAKEKGVDNKWNLLGIVSTNHSLVDKLTVAKGEPDAEINRIFEYEITSGFTRDEGKHIFDAVSQNYGGVGCEYAKYITVHQDEHRAALNKIADMISKKADCRVDERFWCMVGSVAIYGGAIAKKINLSHVDVNNMIDWVCATIRAMRKYKAALAFDEVSYLGTILDNCANNTLVVNSFDPRTPLNVMSNRDPRTALFARIELDKNMLWISGEKIKQELFKKNISMRKFGQSLAEKGLVNMGIRMNLGRGSIYQGIYQNCWEFDLNHPTFGVKILQLVQSFTTKEASK